MKITVALPALDVGASMVVVAGDKRVLVCRSTAGIHALDEICPHQLQSLAGGRVRGTSLFCPITGHGSAWRMDGHSPP